jgi:hypothetical protein
LPKGLVFQKSYSKPTFHPFIITREDGSRIYAGTFTFYELIEDDSICSAMQTLQTMYDAESSNSKKNSFNISSSMISQNTSQSASIPLNNRNNNQNNYCVNNHQRSLSVSMTGSYSKNLNKKINNRNFLTKLAIANTTPISTKTNVNKILINNKFMHEDSIK